MQWIIIALLANVLGFACFVLAARAEWDRIKPHYDLDLHRVLPGGRWVPYGDQRQFFVAHRHTRYNLAVILQWASLVLFVYEVFLAAAALK